MVKKVKWKSSVKPEDNYIVRKEKEFLDRQSEAKYKYQKKNQTSKSASVNKLAQLLFPMAIYFVYYIFVIIFQYIENVYNDMVLQ